MIAIAHTTFSDTKLSTMTPSRPKAYSSVKSASVKSSKRKASSTPDSGALTKRATTRQSISIEENTLVSIVTPKNPRKREKTEAVAAEESPAVENSGEVPKTTSRKVKQEVIEAEEDHGNKVSPNKNKRKQKEQIKKEEEKIEESSADEDTPKTAKRKRYTKREEAEEEQDEEEGQEGTPKKVKRKRKTKEEREAEAMPLAARTASLRMYIGAHVSSAKGSSWPCRAAVVLVLIDCRIFRSAQRDYQLCSHWVFYTNTTFIPSPRANRSSAVMHLLYFSSPNGSGKILHCRMSIKFYSKLTVRNISTMLRGECA